MEPLHHFAGKGTSVVNAGLIRLALAVVLLSPAAILRVRHHGHNHLYAFGELTLTIEHIYHRGPAGSEHEFSEHRLQFRVVLLSRMSYKQDHFSTVDTMCFQQLCCFLARAFFFSEQ